MKRKLVPDHELTHAAIVERAKSMATQWMLAVALQYDRVANPRVQDRVFHPFGSEHFHEVDVHFLAIALSRLRRITTTIEHVPILKNQITTGIQHFDNRVPWLKQIRDVFEHLEDYAVDSNLRRTSTSRRELQAWSSTANGMNWMGHHIDFNDALDAGRELYKSVLDACDIFRSQSQ